MKQFDATQSEADRASKKGIVLSYMIPQGAVRIRFVLRDATTAHLGSFELPLERISGQPPIYSSPR